MAILKLIVEGQTLKVKSEIDKIVENSINYLDYEIIANDDYWEKSGLTKDVIITYNGGEPERIYSPENTGKIPPSKIHPPCFVISVLGYSVDDDGKKTQVPTNPVAISVLSSGEIPDGYAGEESIDATELETIASLLTQHSAMIQEIISKTGELETDIGDIQSRLTQHDDTIQNLVSDTEDITEIARQNSSDIVKLGQADEAIKENVNNSFANSMKKIVKGDQIKVEDISPIEHITKVNVHGKNFWKIEDIVEDFEATDGFTYSYNKGTFTITGTTKNDAGGGRTLLGNKSWAKTTLPKGTYTYSINVISGDMSKFSTFMHLLDNNTSPILDNYTFTLTETSRILFGVNKPAESGVQCDVSFNIQIEAGDTATKYEKYIKPSGIKIRSSGKNLISYPYIQSEKETINGVIFTVNADRSITVTGRATEDAIFKLSTIDLDNIDFVKTDCLYDNVNKQAYLLIPKGTEVNKVFRPQIEVGNTATEWEQPGSFNEYISDENGNISIPSMSPSISLVTNTDGAIIEFEYNKDTSDIYNYINENIVDSCANTLKGHVKDKVIKIDDVSPIKHTIKAIAKGKNLLNPAQLIKASKNTTLNEDVFTTNFENGSLFLNGPAYYHKTIIPPGLYTVTVIPDSETFNAAFLVYDAETRGLIFNKHIGTAAGTYTHTFEVTKPYIPCLGGLGNHLGTYSYKIQLEVGEKSTEYKPYLSPSEILVTEEITGKTYVPREDGIINILSESPSMILSTNDEEVIIELEYNKDTSTLYDYINNQLTSALLEKEDKSKKVTNIDKYSTNEQYAGAKAVYDCVALNSKVINITEDTYVFDLETGIYYINSDAEYNIYLSSGNDYPLHNGILLVSKYPDYCAWTSFGFDDSWYNFPRTGMTFYNSQKDEWIIDIDYSGELEFEAHKTYEINNESTSGQYPSAKAVYDFGMSILEEVEVLIGGIENGSY